MKISEALIILNIKNYNIYNIHNISLNELKKYYHIQCLIYHPDKNNICENSTLLFQNINSAYNVLKDIISTDNDDDANNDGKTNNYNDLLLTFLNFIIKYYSNNDALTGFKDDITKFKHNANIHIKAIITSLFDNFSIVILEDLYCYLLKYNKLKSHENTENTENNEKYENNENNENTENNIYNAIIEIIKTILEEKLSNHSIYILTPKLTNLLNSDVYKLEINDVIVYIPLWHNEMKFENNIIKIEPLLDDHVNIDEHNNIHYTYYNNFNNIIELLKSNSNIAIDLADQTIEININDLKFSKYQVYNVKHKGIPKINTLAILDNSNKGDIYFHIHLA
jgi:curved DNA-binding protein CbpA